WTYTVNDSKQAVQALNDGDHLTDTFTVHTTDGTAQVVTVTIDGQNEHFVGTDNDDVMTGTKYGDTFAGGDGDDIYIVNNTHDVVQEDANKGDDLVKASVSYTLSNNVENLTLTGHANLNGTGNGLDNVIVGNDGKNSLWGMGGDDTLRGGDENDTLNG